MRYLRKFNESATTFMTDVRQIRKYCSERGINISFVNPDGTVDVFDTCYLTNFEEQNLPFRFGDLGGLEVSSSSLTSLEGCPKIIKGSLNFTESEITNMIGGPEVVSGNVEGMGSALTSLEGVPKKVRGSFGISKTQVTSLIGLPESIGWTLDVSNLKITSLEGCPETITGNLIASFTGITNLRGAPKEIGGEAEFNSCKLTSLEGIPQKIGGDLSIQHNRIWDPSPLRNIQIGNHFYCSGTTMVHLVDFFYNAHHLKYGHGTLTYQPIPGRYDIEEPFKDFLDSLDYNYIRGTADKPLINQFRFKEALDEIIPIWRRAWNEYMPWVTDKSKFGNYRLVDNVGNYVDIDGNTIK